MSLPINDQLDAIFGIPKDGSNIKEEEDSGQETSYAEVIVADEKVDFEVKAKKISDQLAKDEPQISMITAKKEEISNVKIEPTRVEPGSTRIEQKGNSFEKILTESIRPKNTISKEVQPVVQQQAINYKDTESEEEEKETVPVSDAVRNTPSVSPIFDHKADADGWFLNPPSPMFNHFYSEKSNFIRIITKGCKPLDFNKLTSELISSTVSTNVELSDLPGMAEKLTRIQDFLDRVVQIKIQATSQCASSKRGVELLRGVLAKVSYEKPAARQDGVIYDHMRDIEMYASSLESLEQNAKDVYHNLLEAKEILSRKISISIELVKEQNKLDILEKTFNNLPENAKTESLKKIISTPTETPIVSRLANEGYDRLEVQEAVVKSQITTDKKSNKKSGSMSWLD